MERSTFGHAENVVSSLRPKYNSYLYKMYKSYLPFFGHRSGHGQKCVHRIPPCRPPVFMTQLIFALFLDERVDATWTQNPRFWTQICHFWTQLCGTCSQFMNKKGFPALGTPPRFALMLALYFLYVSLLLSALLL